jgi:hypothetical protein
MTTLSDLGTAAPAPDPAPAAVPKAPDHRGSWIPTWRMIVTRLMELRTRRGLMIAMIVVIIGLPTLFLVIRLISHAVDPKSYGPAGGSSIFASLMAGVIYVFGFIMAATLGATAGSSDLSDGMFRHLVVTGRSRLALYLARIPAGLAIVWSLIAASVLIVCVVCVFAAPTQLNYDGVNVPTGLSQSGLETWAANHAELVLCEFNFNGPIDVAVACGPNGPVTNGPAPVIQNPSPGPGKFVQGNPFGGSATKATPTQIRAAAVELARFNYTAYSQTFLTPSTSLMVRSGLWLELEATIGFIVGLGLASLLGQRTVAVILIIVLEIILTPIVSTHVIPHFINAERAIVGLANDHLEPAGLPLQFHGGGGGPNGPVLVPESKEVAIIVIVSWLVGWTVLGAWRMMTRDA